MKRIYFLLVLTLLIAVNGFASTATDRFGRDIKIVNKETNPKKPANECAYINNTMVISVPENTKQTQVMTFDKKHNTFWVTIKQGKKVVGSELYDMYGELIRRFPAISYVIRYNANSVVVKQLNDTTKTIQVLTMSIDEYNGHKCLNRSNEQLSKNNTDEAIRLYRWALDLGCPMASKSTLADMYYKAAQASTVQTKYYEYMDASARLGKVEAMETLIKNYTDRAGETTNEAQKEMFRKARKEWAALAYNEGSAVGAYWLGLAYLDEYELSKACSYFEYASRKGYQPAREALTRVNDLTKAIPVRGHLPEEMEAHLLNLTEDDIYVLAHKGYLEAMKYYCRQSLFFVYGIPDMFLRDVTDALRSNGETPTPVPLSNRTAMAVIPVLNTLALSDPASKLMLACCLSDMRCFNAVSPEQEHAFVDLKRAQQLAREYISNPAPAGQEPWGIKAYEAREMANNILRYDANYQRPTPSFVKQDVSLIPTYAQIIATKPQSTTTTTTSTTTTTKSTSTNKVPTPPNGRGERTMAQLIYYPMGLGYMPIDGKGIIEWNEESKMLDLVKANTSAEYKYQEDEKGDARTFYFNTFKVTHKHREGTPHYHFYKTGKSNGWWYTFANCNRSELNEWLRELNELGFNMTRKTSSEDKYTIRCYEGGKGSYRVKIEMYQWSSGYEIWLHAYPNYNK